MVALNQRQLPNLLSVLLPVPSIKPLFPTRSAGLTSSESVTQSDPSSSSTSVISLTQASSTTSASSTASQSSSTVPSSTSSSSLSSSISPTSTITSTPVPSALPIETSTGSVDGSTYFVTMYATPTPSPSIQATPPNSSSGFLQNKALSGIVFTIAGVVGLVLLITVATIAIRRSRNKRLHNEAVSFDPTDRGSTEKRRWSLISSDNGHGGMGGNLGYPGAAAPLPPAYSRQGGFPGAESQHSLIGHSQQPRYGGASAPYFSQTDLRPAWMSGNESNPAQLPKTPDPTDRVKSPESVVYPEVGNLKITNA